MRGSEAWQKPTVLILGIDWPPETFLIRLIDGLIDAGVEVTVASHHRPEPERMANANLQWLSIPHWRGPKIQRIARVGFQIGRAAVTDRGSLKRAADHASDSKNLIGRMRKYNRLLPLAGGHWDVVYFPWNTAAIEYLPVFDTRCRTLVSCRGSQVNIAPHNPERSIQDGLRKTLRKATAVHCVSNAVYEEALQYGLDPDKAHIIRPAVDPSTFAPRERRPRDGFRIVSTGSLVWKKGHEYSLLVIRELKDQGIPVHYDIIGDGPDRQRLTYTIHDLDLQDEVTLSGRVDPMVVRDRLQRSDIFLLMSLTEGISNAALEGMSCGLPIVTTDCGGMPEAVTDRVEGFVVPARDPVAAANALEELWRSADLRETMGEAGRQRVLRDFNLRDQVEAFVELFSSVAGARVAS